MGSNRRILRRLKEDDPDFTQLWVAGPSLATTWYIPRGPHDQELGWLGYFIGKNTHLEELTLYYNKENRHFSNDAIKSFCKELNSNRSIQKITFYEMNLSGGEIVQSLRPFF